MYLPSVFLLLIWCPPACVLPCAAEVVRSAQTDNLRSEAPKTPPKKPAQVSQPKYPHPIDVKSPKCKYDAHPPSDVKYPCAHPLLTSSILQDTTRPARTSSILQVWYHKACKVKPQAGQGIKPRAKTTQPIDMQRQFLLDRVCCTGLPIYQYPAQGLQICSAQSLQMCSAQNQIKQE